MSLFTEFILVSIQLDSLSFSGELIIRVSVSLSTCYVLILIRFQLEATLNNRHLMEWNGLGVQICNLT